MEKDMMVPVFISRNRLIEESGSYQYISEYISSERDNLNPDFWLPISKAVKIPYIGGVCFFDMAEHNEVEYYICGDDNFPEAREFLMKLAIEITLNEEVLK